MGRGRALHSSGKVKKKSMLGKSSSFLFGGPQFPARIDEHGLC